MEPTGRPGFGGGGIAVPEMGVKKRKQPPDSKPPTQAQATAGQQAAHPSARLRRTPSGPPKREAPPDSEPPTQAQETAGERPARA
ncbi:hypothetical protein Aca07nite_33600 [Actinoplanes capillaceus]|uniref:Uncharacterized protein n=1 Tax=Actinoplanes campanulatus TaxID=113559 RepID=A0ABQ3WIK0_9ACTN|nr:hypothetical protein Aca07nite_33600 [Actinoplanes capillaceus]